MIALIDGDVLVYKCGFAAQSSTYVSYWKEQWFEFNSKKELNLWLKDKENAPWHQIVQAEPIENALHNVKLKIEQTLRDTNSDDFILYLSGDSNFREQLVDYYKKNRDPNHKPVHYKGIKDYMLSKYAAVVSDNEEADDCMGVDQVGTHNTFDEDKTVICTIDKDLDMIPGWHYNFDTGQLYYMTEQDSTLAFYTQLLSGDSTDNIPGLYKLTGKMATAGIKGGLKDCGSEEEMYEYVRNTYLNNGIDPLIVDDQLTEIGRLLWIRRKTGEMWTPPLPPWEEEDEGEPELFNSDSGLRLQDTF